MEARARMTSKGQLTVPVEVRRALKIESGDTVVFEVAESYATMRKRRPTLEVAEEARARCLGDRALRAITNREAIEEHFVAQAASQPGAVLYVSAGDGTFSVKASPEVDGEDADR